VSAIVIEGLDKNDLEEQPDANEMVCVLNIELSLISPERKDFIISQLAKFGVDTVVPPQVSRLLITKYSEMYSQQREQKYGIGHALDPDETLAYDMEVMNMVDRIAAGEGLSEFKGKVETIEKVTGEYGEQIHMTIRPDDSTIIKKGRTGCFHEYLRFSPKASEDHLIVGSVLETYVKKIEAIFKDAKNLKTVSEVLDLLKGKSILFRRETLGKNFEQNEATEHWVPVIVA
jgi:hypothetical protein